MEGWRKESWGAWYSRRPEHGGFAGGRKERLRISGYSAWRAGAETLSLISVCPASLSILILKTFWPIYVQMQQAGLWRNAYFSEFLNDCCHQLLKRGRTIKSYSPVIARKDPIRTSSMVFNRVEELRWHRRGSIWVMYGRRVWIKDVGSLDEEPEASRRGSAKVHTERDEHTFVSAGPICPSPCAI